jgi:protein TonB
MPLFPPRTKFSTAQETESWFKRVRDNLRQATVASKFAPSSTSGAPFYFDSAPLWAQTGPAQTYSVAAHAAVIVAALLLLTAAHGHRPEETAIRPELHIPLDYHAPRDTRLGDHPSPGSPTSGGGNNPVPPRAGNLAPPASILLASPRLPENREPLLPVPPVILDSHAPETVRTETNLGLPWMRIDTQSAGHGKNGGMGVGDDANMGDQPGDGTGGPGDDPAAYSTAVSGPVCKYCPEPPYTEEARKAKLQGTVTIEVLVGMDGTAKRVRVLKGLGMGLNEQLISSVRNWRFGPARDAQHQAIPCWVRIETMFRLY